MSNAKVRLVANMFKAIHVQESLVAAEQKAQAVIEQLHEMKLTKVAELVEWCISETLTYYRYPDTY